MQKNRLFLVILAGLVFIVLAVAVAAGGKEKKYDFSGRTITYATWWEYKPQPGRSEREDLRLQREAEIAKKYNVKIDYTTVPWGEFTAKYITTVMAGDAMADIASVQIDWFYPTLLMNNFCLNLSALNVFDFTAPKWQRETVDFATLDGDVYGYEIGRIEPRGAIFFNKAMFEREGLPDLYEVFFNYEWTWDKMLEFAQKLTKDTDGDGIVDQWGIGGATGRVWCGLLLSNNAHFIDISDKRNPRFSMGDPNAIEALQFFQDLAIKYKVMLVKPEGAPYDYPVQAFLEGKLGMLCAQIWNIDKMRDNMKDEYGIVLFPIGPKMKEYTAEASGHHLRTFPVTVKNPEQVAMVEDALTEPYKIDGELRVIEEKNEEWLEMRVTDEESIQVVQMIWDKQLSVFNFQAAFGIMDIFYTIEWELEHGQNTPRASVEEYSQEAQMRINDYMAPL
ncbi:MAG: extracellular solute-binding protein [Firmicutes bacterium]|nr:extracellular solute-binding protein [Bacillota bacterium]